MKQHVPVLAVVVALAMVLAVIVVLALCLRGEALPIITLLVVSVATAFGILGNIGRSNTPPDPKDNPKETSQ